MQPEKTRRVKLRTEILKDKKGKIISIEEFVYNSYDKLIRQNFKDNSQNLKYYTTFEYNEKGNCIKTINFSKENEFQGSFEYTYNSSNNIVKTIERTIDSSIYNWYEEIEQPESNLKIWLSKDKNGAIIHKTVENLFDHVEKRYYNQEDLYEIHHKKFDNLNRLLERLVTDEKGNEKEKHLYFYENQKETWKYILNGSTIKTEERIFDENRNEIYYIRKDKNGKSLGWHSFEFDKFGNRTKYIWGKDEGKEIGFKTIEIIYKEIDN
ncbi:hypothetical protein FCR2A7T_29820 [Flavobacterium cauense R2A-7]|uniref:YD repeat-containing protein n=2 Tax=Flavobacterium TaxID=237 RepID=V6RW46_9FLAO|nr:hypothetical protein FCR2A7T_29820 [Flavobacterium cauense R2A-7]KGO78596.1 hypothetical protein Q762_15095 [Flavobacterium cauense R2A-7]TWI07394.1 hypothetical protein IP98_02939 [Flavobacterium cauense R2A-7]